MSPAVLLAQAESHLWSVFDTGQNPWRAGAQLVSRRLGVLVDDAASAVSAAGGVYARVVSAEDPRRFRLAVASERDKATPCLLLPISGRAADATKADDVLALSLLPGSGRFWRADATVAIMGDLTLSSGGALLLRQDAHDWARRALKAAAAEVRGERDKQDAAASAFAQARASSGLEDLGAALELPEGDPRRRAYLDGVKAGLRAAADAKARWQVEARMPVGALVLDPPALNWTRRGLLVDAESIEILDAPATGPLARVLVRLNPTIGKPHGVPLYGLGPSAPAKWRAA